MAARAARFPVVAGPVQFGPIRLDPRQVFYVSPSGLSVAVVNLRPFLPGHTLVIPARVVPRFGGLRADELGDLWATAELVRQMLERRFRATGFTLVVQDGADAGQSVPHVHAHVIPRRRGDIENNDDIYDELAKRDEAPAAGVDVDAEGRRPRTIEEMAAEAEEFAALMAQSAAL